MKEVDLDLVRPVLCVVKFQGQRFEIKKPTVYQRILHTRESREAREDQEKIENSDKLEEYKGSEVAEFLYNWRIRELRIFLPEIDEDTAQSLTVEQINRIMEIIFPPEDGEDGEPDKKKGGKKKKAGGE